MPKRTEIIKKIEDAAKANDIAFTLKRHGANHDIYDLDGAMIPVQRHRNFTTAAAEKIYRECQPKLGRGWWR
ncbi:MAG: hypothetical protein K2Q25_15165 [Mycobacteriaceae bacterium]|nr:hypothetical protein [Mycobacteriaceae bacterium]